MTQTGRLGWCLKRRVIQTKMMMHLFIFLLLSVVTTLPRTNPSSSARIAFVDAFQSTTPTTTTTRTQRHRRRPPQHFSTRRRERSTAIYARNEEDEKKKTGYTPISDGSPIGLAIVALGGAYVVFGQPQDTGSLPEISVWAIFLTASLAAGVERLLLNKKKL